MEKDGNTLTDIIVFFERMRKEIKRSLKVTIDKIKNPGRCISKTRQILKKKPILLFPRLRKRQIKLMTNKQRSG